MIHAISRRNALAAGAAALLAPRKGLFAADLSLHFTILDHVSIALADVAKSVDFYAKVFGNTLRKENDSPRYYVKLGLSYLAMAQPRGNGQAGSIDHFCAGFDSQEMSNAKAQLKRLDIKFTSPPPFGLFFADPEGIRVQMWTENSWTDVGRTTSPVPHELPGGPIFEPTRLDHLLLAVSDLDAATLYYRKLFGPAIREGKAKDTWFKLGPSRIGLIQAKPGESPHIERFCVAALPFDSAAVTKKLGDAGAKMENPERKGSVKFRDADGILVEVI
jgi:catechol 2,3-dioxygenase-like lactoylglutathione lyase family enzyme